MTQRLYIQGLPFRTDWREIKDAVRQAIVVSYENPAETHEPFTIGKVELAKNDGKSLGIATVEVSTSDAAKRAIRKLNGTMYHKRQLKVSLHNSEKPLNVPRT